MIEEIRQKIRPPPLFAMCTTTARREVRSDFNVKRRQSISHSFGSLFPAMLFTPLAITTGAAVRICRHTFPSLDAKRRTCKTKFSRNLRPTSCRRLAIDRTHVGFLYLLFDFALGEKSDQLCLCLGRYSQPHVFLSLPRCSGWRWPTALSFTVN